MAPLINKMAVVLPLHLFFCAASTLAQSANSSNYVYVTNWITAPSNYRTISNKLYDAYSAPGWISLTLPPNGIYRLESDSVTSGDTKYVTLEGTIPGKVPMTFSILHFPYHKEDFTRNESGELRTLRKRPSRVFPLNFGTNHWHLGRTEGVKLIYDHGLPSTNKIPIVKRYYKHSHN